MDPEHLESLKRSHGLEGWDRAAGGGSGLFVWNLAFDGDEFPGWSLAGEQYVVLPNGSRVASTIWQPEEGGRRGPIRLDAICHPSAQAAFDAFVLRLSDVQLQDMVRQAVEEIGELLFVSKAGSLALSLHGNVVAEAAAIGGLAVPALEFLHEFDVWLVDEAGLSEPIPEEVAASAGAPLRLLDDVDTPDEAAAAVGVAAMAAGMSESPPQAAVPPAASFHASAVGQDFPQPDFALMRPTSERPPVVKVFFEEGDVLAADGGLNFVPVHEGRPPLRIARVSAGTRLRRRRGDAPEARPEGERR